MELATESRVLGRDGRLGAVAVEVAGSRAEDEVAVIAVEAAELPAVGDTDSDFPVDRYG